MDFRHLKYFIAVAEEENIGRAAKRLNISQPPLTRQIRQLEEEINVQLFLRTPKGMELTAAGALFLEEARNIRMLSEQAVERTQRASQGKLGRLDIAIFGSGILDAIPKILSTFRELFPDVSVLLHQMAKGEQIEALRQRRINIGFNRLLAPVQDLRTELVQRERVLVALPATHPLAQEKTIPLEDLAHDSLILYPATGRPNFADKVSNMCIEAGFTPKVSQEVEDAVNGVALVASGFGVCLIPESLTVLGLPGVVFRALRDPRENWSVDLSCLYRANDQSPILAEFLKIVRAFRDAHEKSTIRQAITQAITQTETRHAASPKAPLKAHRARGQYPAGIKLVRR